MGVFDVVSQRAAALERKAASPRARLRYYSPTQEQYNIPDPSQAERQSNLYANLSPFQSAIGTVAHAVATTKFNVHQRTAGELNTIKNHPFELRLEQPNDREDQFEFLVNTASWLGMSGESYWWKNTIDEFSEPDELWVIPKTKIMPVPDGNMGIKGYLYDNGSGVPTALYEWEVVHIKMDWNPLNEYVALSGVQALGVDGTADLAAQRFNANFYGKNNAKIAGILAFGEYITDDKWNRLMAARDEEHGGTKNNRIMMLRGAGDKGVTWTPTQLSQADIQYLEQRRYTKEEIFERFAPGLASILAINATEANSTAGKDTFYEFAVYALTVAIASKITHKVLPLYGSGLVGAFDDVRRVDTQIELQVQAEYAKTHTVDEIRAKYYQEKPLGDERGNLLPAEIGKGMTDARKPEDKPLPQINMQTPLPPDPIATGKAEDLRRWRTVALKQLAAGKAPGGRVFDPDSLSDGETSRIRAGLLHAQSEEQVKAVFEG